VNQGTNRNIADRQGIARLDRRLLARLNLVAGAYVFRRDDVSTLAVRVENQREMRASIRIVFDALDLTDDTVLVTTKIDDAITSLMTTAAMTRRDPALVVTTARLGLLCDERLVRLTLVQLWRIDLDRKTAACRCRSEFL